MSVDRTVTGAAASLIESRDVAVHYGGIKAVDGISMHLTSGKIFGIMGPNGSGKSTLLAALTGLAPLTRGELLFEGRPYHGVPPRVIARRGISRTFQTVRLLHGRTVRANVELATDVRRDGPRRTRAQLSEQVDEAVERTGLTGVQKLYPEELSYGTQRRVEIARAIASQPRLLMLDEPTAGMTRHEREEVSELMMKLRGEGLAQLLIEHDVQMMVDTCDYLFAMNFGKMIAEGVPTDVVRVPEVQEAYLGKRERRQHA